MNREHGYTSFITPTKRPDYFATSRQRRTEVNERLHSQYSPKCTQTCVYLLRTSISDQSLTTGLLINSEAGAGRT
jgi:hypothetical protein